MAEDSISIKLPSLKKIKKKTWAISTIIVGVIAVAAIVLLAISYFSGSSSFCSFSEGSGSAQQTAQNIVSLLNAQTNSTVQLENVTSFSGIYEIDVNYQNQTIPVYSTQDGKYLLQGIYPIQ